MTNDDSQRSQTSHEEKTAKGEPATTASPPSNPPVDEESHEKGKEQLGKIVGN